MAALSEGPARTHWPQRHGGRPRAGRKTRAEVLRRLIAWQIALGLGGPGLVAVAAGDEPESTLSQVVVTGSRIPVADVAGAAPPLQVITSRDIRLAGYTDAVDLIDSLPQANIDSSADFGNHSNPAVTAGGIATADLRGLGPQRTLILVNGRRLGVGDPNTGNPAPAPDLDQIPLAMVERVEIVTGGASSTYGSDAVAGVVNFILKKHIDGVQIDAQYGFAQHDQHEGQLQALQRSAAIEPPAGSTIDGGTGDLAVLAGAPLQGGAGSVTAYYTYHRQEPVSGSARDFANCQAVSINALTGVPTDAGFKCLGSSDSNKFVTDAGGGPAYSVVGGNFVPYPAGGSVPPARFNPAPYQYLQREDTRHQAGLLAYLSLGAAARPYLELGYMDDRTDTEIAPSGLFQGNNTLTADGTYLVNCSNPLLSAQEAATICTPAEIAADAALPGSASAAIDIGRRNIEGGGRESLYEHRSYRAVAGVDGELGSAWSYDAYGLYHHTSLYQANLNYFNYAAVNRALQATTNGAGQIVCISDGGCVPYDIFTTGGVTASQLQYLYTPGTDSGASTEVAAHLDVTGELGRYGLTSPWAADGLAVNAGVEHRSDRLRFAPDAAELSGDLAGYGGAAVAIDRRVSVDEAFVEARLPIAHDRPLLRDLLASAGYRYSHYSTAGAANTYKFELQLAPARAVRLRYAFDRVVRAANIIELYTPLSYEGSTSVASDPCAPTQQGAVHAAASLAQCANTGVTAAQYGDGYGAAAGGTSTIPQCPNFACGEVIGGNTRLAPEVARTWSVGLTFTPPALPALAASLDYYRIRVEQEIATVPGIVTLQRCLATGNPLACGEIVRRADGALAGATVPGGGYILQNDVNTGAALVSGIDFRGSYRWQLPGRWGFLRAVLNGAWLQHDSVTVYAGAPSYDCAGLFGNTCFGGSVNPSWRHSLRLIWQTPWALLLSARWRFIGRASFDNNSPQPLLRAAEEGFLDPQVTRIASYSYLDLAGIWTGARWLQVRCGVNNLLDKDPPFIPAADISSAAGTINTFPLYDLMGREIFMAVRATF
ncbi:MAG TPA: TonB-dependent receptor [Steroidobacteraceae bacterium]|nr:TonB-dependent receptor [Steroidobacteraceae bacterium]